jgi:hypothetical protein
MVLVFLIITAIAVILLLLNALLYSSKIKVDDSGLAKILSIYLWVMFSIQILSDIVAFLFNYSLFFAHIYFYSQFILIGIFYYSICKHPKQRAFIRWYITGVTLFLLIQYLFASEISYRYNIVEVFLTNYFFVICPLMYIYNTTPEEREFSYLNLGFLAYGISGGTIFLFGNTLAYSSLELSSVFYFIHLLILFFLYIMQLMQWQKLFGKKRYKISD